MAKKKSLAHQLPDLEQIWSSGQDSDTISVGQASTGELLSHYLRHYRGRNDLASVGHLLTPESTGEAFFQGLEMARTLIFKNHLTAALAVLQELQPRNPSEEAEVCIEEMRIALTQGSWQKALSHSDRIVRTSSLIAPSLLTCYQLRGHAYIMASDYELSVLSLAKALDLATLFPHQRSAFSAAAFMVLALSLMGDLESAEQHLGLLQEKISLIENTEQRVDRLLMLTRAQFHYFKASGDLNSARESLLESKEISFWLGEEATFKKCIQDLQALGVCGQKKSETVSSFPGWTYLKRHHLILGLIPKTVISIASSELTQKALNLLSSGPASESEFFEKIWGLSYHSDRHAQHLRSSLSNLRKALPAQALVYKNQTIYLK